MQAAAKHHLPGGPGAATTPTSQGLVHRDVKPGNVLVTPDGRAKLSDLGLAGPLADGAEKDPRFGKIVGTADYLSPDHIESPWEPTPAWDIYSLGCTLYYAVTGKVPFPGGTHGRQGPGPLQAAAAGPAAAEPGPERRLRRRDGRHDGQGPGRADPLGGPVMLRLAPWVDRPIPASVARKVERHSGSGRRWPAADWAADGSARQRPAERAARGPRGAAGRGGSLADAAGGATDSAMSDSLGDPDAEFLDMLLPVSQRRRWPAFCPASHRARSTPPIRGHSQPPTSRGGPEAVDFLSSSAEGVGRYAAGRRGPSSC